MPADRETGLNEKGNVDEQKAGYFFRDWIGGYVVYMLQLEAVLRFPLQLETFFPLFLPGHMFFKQLLFAKH